jgi:hypothetical protein
MSNSNGIYNGIKETPQTIYDSFNTLMFSEDSRVFHKMIKKIGTYNEVRHLVGDIVEFGVFKGAGLALFLKLTKLNEPHGLTKVIGFDYFKPANTLNELVGINKELMENVLKRVGEDELSVAKVRERLDLVQNPNFLLLEGEAVATSKQYYEMSPGARIKLLYMDLDVGEPTYNILKNLWSRVVPNGIVVFDEYGYHKWDESDGVDAFLKEIPGQFKVVNTNIISPTLYIQKNQ